MSEVRGSPKIQSEFATDPDMIELIDTFISELPGKISQLKTHWQEQQLDDVQRMAHQLKGSSGGYGFPTLGAAAAEVEKSLLALGEGSSRSSTSELRSKLEELFAVSSRITG